MKNYFLTSYKKRLESIPAPGGNGCHSAILGVANYGVMAGLTPEQIYSDIRRAIPHGRRNVPDREIQSAILKAFSDQKKTIRLPNGEFHNRYTPSKNEPVIHSGKIALQNIIKQGSISTEAELRALSPISLCGTKENDFILFLNNLYEPDDLLWMGEQYDPGIVGQSIRYVYDWIKLFRRTGKTAPFFIINPLSGKPAPKISGDGETYRGNLNISKFKHALVEYDTLTHEEQIRFWSAVKLPVRCLIDSGGKSIHALLDVQKIAKIETLDQWHTQIKSRLYDQLLTPMGVDAACSNPARLSRLPGHYRNKKNNWQRLLWLSLEGRSISNG